MGQVSELIERVTDRDGADHQPDCKVLIGARLSSRDAFYLDTIAGIAGMSRTGMAQELLHAAISEAVAVLMDGESCLQFSDDLYHEYLHALQEGRSE